jgi:hypothetical protein
MRFHTSIPVNLLINLAWADALQLTVTSSLKLDMIMVGPVGYEPTT